MQPTRGEVRVAGHVPVAVLPGSAPIDHVESFMFPYASDAMGWSASVRSKNPKNQLLGRGRVPRHERGKKVARCGGARTARGGSARPRGSEARAGGEGVRTLRGYICVLDGLATRDTVPALSVRILKAGGVRDFCVAEVDQEGIAIQMRGRVRIQPTRPERPEPPRYCGRHLAYWFEFTRL